MSLKSYTLKGDDYLQKVVIHHSQSAGRIYLPVGWIGKKVAVILLEE